LLARLRSSMVASFVGSPFPAKAPTVGFKYNYYPPSGSGRDTFITHVSNNQTSWSYTQNPPWLNMQQGQASNMTSRTTQSLRPAVSGPKIVGYTGHVEGSRHTVGANGLLAPAPTTANKSMPLGAGLPQVGGLSMGAGELSKTQQLKRQATPSFRIPGYAGHAPGHKHAVGLSFGAIGEGAAGDDVSSSSRTAVMAPPGMINGSNEVPLQRNLQPDVVMETMTVPCVGYTGHIQGAALSANFGKAYAVKAKEAPSYPSDGGVGDPERKWIADVERTLPFTRGHVGRPPRYAIAIKRYAGFRPASVPF